MKRLICLLIALGAASLTSCKVNWFDKQYDVPWWTVAIPVTVITVTVILLAGKIISSKKYICPECGKSFHPKWWQAMLSLHINSDRLFKCPHCGKRSFCSPSREKQR